MNEKEEGLVDRKAKGHRGEGRGEGRCAGLVQLGQRGALENGEIDKEAGGACVENLQVSGRSSREEGGRGGNGNDRDGSCHRDESLGEAGRKRERRVSGPKGLELVTSNSHLSSSASGSSPSTSVPGTFTVTMLLLQGNVSDLSALDHDKFLTSPPHPMILDGFVGLILRGGIGGEFRGFGAILGTPLTILDLGLGGTGGEVKVGTSFSSLRGDEGGEGKDCLSSLRLMLVLFSSFLGAVGGGGGSS